MVIKVVETVLEIIHQVKSAESQILVIGYRGSGNFIITGVVDTSCLGDFKDDSTPPSVLVESFLPQGFHVLGCLKSSKQDLILKNSDENQEFLEFYFADDEMKLNCRKIRPDDGKTEMDIVLISFSETMKFFAENCLLFNIQENLSIPMDVTDTKTAKNCLFEGLESLKNRFESKNLAFDFPSSNTFIFGDKMDQKPLSEFLKINEKERLKKVQKLDFYSPRQFLSHEFMTSVNIFENSTLSDSECFAPTISFSESACFVDVSVKLCAVAFLAKNATVGEAKTALQKSLIREIVNSMVISAYEFKILLEDSKTIKSDDFTRISCSNFCLPNSACILNFCCPNSLRSDAMKDFKKLMHKLFITPSDRPVFTSLNAIQFENQDSQVLCNTHIGLKTPVMDGGEVSTVSGIYGYHHYMQDNIDDNGWGCAYRSCQTIISWFRYQGYTDAAIPSHIKIQEALVAVGDKQKSFIGSRQWIGSIEINNVLSHLLGVTSKIMFVSRGSELVSKGRELAAHFKEQGTPVMIGGGVLAHTILGVCFSEITGETKFLILDPHYTGDEDLKIIQTKGWCGWKGSNFWDQNAYYNLCLPQRPVTF